MGELAIQESIEVVKRTKTFGRPMLYSDAITKAVCDKVKRGIRPEAAAIACGIHRDTYYHWMQTIEEFSDAVLRADAEAEETYSEVLYTGATDTTATVDGKLAIEWLKRRRRPDYGDQIDVRKIDTVRLMEILQAQASAEPAPLALEDGQSDL